jgi:hypothetical protein
VAFEISIFKIYKNYTMTNQWCKAKFQFPQLMLLDFEYIVITFNLLFGFVFGGKNRKENKRV